MHIHKTIINKLKKIVPEYGVFHSYKVDDFKITVVVKNVNCHQQIKMTAALNNVLEYYYEDLTHVSLVSGTYTYTRTN